MNTKSVVVRQKISIYFDSILNQYPKDAIFKYIDNVESFMYTGLNDANDQVRKQTRSCFKRYRALFPHRSNQLVQMLEP